MKKYLLVLAVLASCTMARPTYWTGFHGPAYLPARPDAARIRTLDSLTAARWAVPAALFKP